jgi:ABC-type multidrug transport system permease subunit
MEKLKMLLALLLMTIVPIIGNFLFLIIFCLLLFFTPFLKEDEFYRISKRYYNALAKYIKNEI